MELFERSWRSLPSLNHSNIPTCHHCLSWLFFQSWYQRSPFLQQSLEGEWQKSLWWLNLLGYWNCLWWPETKKYYRFIDEFLAFKNQARKIIFWIISKNHQKYHLLPERSSHHPCLLCKNWFHTRMVQRLSTNCLESDQNFKLQLWTSSFQKSWMLMDNRFIWYQWSSACNLIF